MTAIFIVANLATINALQMECKYEEHNLCRVWITSRHSETTYISSYTFRKWEHSRCEITINKCIARTAKTVSVSRFVLR